MTEVQFLDVAESARLTDFARACKAAARAVALYPAAHPAIVTSLTRIADITSASSSPLPLKITVLPDSLWLAGRAPVRPDQAVGELAGLLHDHLVGELTIHPDGDAEAWRAFLLLLVRTPDSVRSDGGIARLCMTTGIRHVELRELDYAEVLRERAGSQAAAWEHVIASCLQGAAFNLDDEMVQAIVDIIGDEQRLQQLVAALDERAAAAGGLPARTAALVRLLRGIADTIATARGDKLELALRNMAKAVGHVSPDMMVELLSQRDDGDGSDARPQVVDQVVHSMSDQTVAGFVSRNVGRDGTATERLAQAFQALVTDPARRHHVIGLARTEAAADGKTPEFDAVWERVRDLLTSYSDSSFVSDSYGRELSGARSQAIEVERVSDDPPERVAVWLATVGAGAVQALDLSLLSDLLRIEDDPQNWHELLAPVMTQIEELLLIGDFESAEQLVTLVSQEAGPNGMPARQPAAGGAIERLAAGPMMRHIVSHLATLDEERFARVKSICLTIGEIIVRPLAEALSVEQRARTRERLTGLLIAFGATGRQTVERLKTSSNPAVRRTAIYLLREFGGSEALPDLTLLLDDAEPQVQREAVRAILNIGTDAAYQVLEQALTSGSTQSREAIMQAIGLVRDERATPLFSYILAHVDHRGPLRSVYLRAIESLGMLRDPEAVTPLTTALYRGEWWAPRRTAQLRTAAALALARIGTPAALDVLGQAAASPSRGVRSIARPALERVTQNEERI